MADEKPVEGLPLEQRNAITLLLWAAEQVRIGKIRGVALFTLTKYDANARIGLCHVRGAFEDDGDRALFLRTAAAHCQSLAEAQLIRVLADTIEALERDTHADR